MMNLSLFDSAEEPQLEQRLRDIFHDWVDFRAKSSSNARTKRALREESAKVYQEMWYAFAAHCAARALDIVDIEADDLQTFLVIRGTGHHPERPRISTKGDDLTPRYAWRMLTLIDRITRFHAEKNDIVPNPAALELLQLPEYRYANASERDPLPEYYTETQAKRLIAFLTEIPPVSDSSKPISWKEVRDRTAVALMLGAGLTPGDVRALTLEGIITEGGRKKDRPWKLAVPGNGNFPARETPLADWAGRQLTFWLAIRDEQQIAGNFVFPSTSRGKALSHTTCYEACKAVLDRSGIGKDSGGVFKLRHTFALRQLAKGKSEGEVAQWLGLLDPNSMARYRRIVVKQVDLA